MKTGEKLFIVVISGEHGLEMFKEIATSELAAMTSALSKHSETECHFINYMALVAAAHTEFKVNIDATEVLSTDMAFETVKRHTLKEESEEACAKCQTTVQCKTHLERCPHCGEITVACNACNLMNCSSCELGSEFVEL